ncbi:MAG: hypothetical protein WAO31_03250 [Rhodoluna sp.]
MDRQAYLRKLRARLEHVEGALSRALELNPKHAIRQKLDQLKEHTKKIDEANDGWEHHREGVEASWKALHGEVKAHPGTLGQMADSIRDGAVELFRAEPPHFARDAEDDVRRSKGHDR